MIRTSDGIRLDVRSVGSGAPRARARILQATRAAGMRKSASLLAIIVAPSTARAAIRPPMCLQPWRPTIKSARPRTWPMWCERSATARRMLWGCRWAALPPFTSVFDTRNSPARWSVAGVGYGAKPQQQADHGLSMQREADHAEAIGMTAFAHHLAGSGYAQCLRAKDEMGWLRFAEQLGEHCVSGMAMTLRGVLARRPSLWHLADAGVALICRSCLSSAMRTRPVSNQACFSRRRCPTRHYASCRVPVICLIWKNRHSSTPSYSGSSRR